MVTTDLSAVKRLEFADRRRSAGLIYEHLRELILDGEIKPDTVISQVELASLLGVSRTPLREALGRLQQEGLIETEPNRRARVFGFNVADLEVVYASRIFYESLGVLQTAGALEDGDVDAIESALADMRRASDAEDYAVWEEAHARFHGLLTVYADPTLQRQTATFAARGERYRKLYQSTVSRQWNIGDPQHEAIARACRERDADLAASELARHLAAIAISLVGRVAPEHEPAVIRGALRLTTRRDGEAAAPGSRRRRGRAG